VELDAGVLYPSTSIGLIALLVGWVVNFYSINKYVGEYTETKDSLPRPQRISVSIGLVVTLFSLLAGYFILLGYA